MYGAVDGWTGGRADAHGGLAQGRSEECTVERKIVSSLMQSMDALALPRRRLIGAGTVHGSFAFNLRLLEAFALNDGLLETYGRSTDEPNFTAGERLGWRLDWRTVGLAGGSTSNHGMNYGKDKQTAIWHARARVVRKRRLDERDGNAQLADVWIRVRSNEKR